MVMILVATTSLSGQDAPGSLIKEDSIRTNQGWVRPWDRVTIIAPEEGKVIDGVFTRKGSKLSKVRLPKGNWICDLKKFMRNKDGQDFLVVYGHEFRTELYLLVKAEKENFLIERQRLLSQVKARMTMLDWADSVWVEGRNYFLRRWDTFMYFNQEFDEHSSGWITRTQRSTRYQETGVFSGGIATEKFRFYMNKLDSAYFIGFTEEETGKSLYYPIDQLRDIRVSIRKNERPFWSYRFEDWERLDQDSLNFQESKFAKDQKISLTPTNGEFGHIFRMEVHQGKSTPVKVSVSELREDFEPDSFRINRFYDVLMNGKYVKLVEILGKLKVRLGGEAPVVGYLICESGYEKDVNLKSD